MDLLFSCSDPRHSGGRAVFIVGTVAHGVDTESIIESSVYIPATSGPNPIAEIPFEVTVIQQAI